MAKNIVISTTLEGLAERFYFTLYKEFALDQGIPFEVSSKRSECLLLAAETYVYLGL